MRRQSNGANDAVGFTSRVSRQITEVRTQVTSLSNQVNTNSESVGYVGRWNADTNTPALGDNGVGGVKGQYYVVSVNGATPIDGNASWLINDWIIHNGSTWDKVNNNGGGGGSVFSVNGKTGVVVLTPADIGLEDVSNESPEEILTDSTLTGTTTLENVIEETKSYTSLDGNSYDLSVDGKRNAVIDNSNASTVTLPLAPTNGFSQRVMNYGTGTISIAAQAPDQIVNLGVGSVLELPNYLDNVTLLYIDGIWNLI